MSRPVGSTLTEDHKRKIAEAHIGKTHSEETKRHLSEIQKGKVLSLETRRKMSERMTGTKQSPEAIEKVRQANIGKKHSAETRRKLSESHKDKWGEKSSHWKGGITPVAQAVRNSLKYARWRQDCFIRDKFTCQQCGDDRGGNLEVHHKRLFSVLLKEAIKYLPLFKEFEAVMAYEPMWNLNNGITLCSKCHQKKNRRK